MTDRHGLFIAIVALLCVLSCAKEEPKGGISPTPTPEQEYQKCTLQFKSSKSQVKSIMDAEGNMAWQSGDVVKFFDGTTTVSASPENIQGATAEFTVVGLDPKAARYYAAYPAAMVDDFAANGAITFKSYGTELQTLEDSYCAVAACPSSDEEMIMSFRNVSYIFRITRPESGLGSDAVSVTFLTKDVQPVSSGITVTLADGATPEIANIQKGSDGTYTASAQFDGNGVAIINIDPLVAENGYAFVAKDANGVAQGLQLIPKVDGKKKTFASGHFLSFQLALSEEPKRPDPEPTIDGLTFAQGNLYYDNGWGIEKRQYDFRTWAGKPCCIDGVYSEEATGTEEINNIGLFYWTPSPDKSRAKNFDSAWSTTEESTGDFFADKIFSGWRAMTKAEFEHVASGRTNADALRARATIVIQSEPVQTITGVILLPDNFGSNPGYELDSNGKWILPFGIDLETARSKPLGKFSDNTLSKAQWSMFECSGAVFLPAAGKTGAEHIYIKESLKSLYYWSSYYLNYLSGEHRAFFAEGHDIIPGSGTYGNCAQGFAVRLVSSGK